MYRVNVIFDNSTLMLANFFFSGTVIIFIIMKKKLHQSQFYNRDVIFHWFDVQTSEKLHPRLKNKELLQ